MTDAIIVNTVRENLHSLPADGVDREALLRRTTELCAEREALFALEAEVGSRAPGFDADLLHASLELVQNGERTAAARATLASAMTSSAFQPKIADCVLEMRQFAATFPASGACTVASALQLWMWTAQHFIRRADCPPSVLPELADGFAALAAARAGVVAAVRASDPASSRALLLDLSHLHAARTAGTVAARCAELVHGYRRHPAWDREGCESCYGAEELDELEGLMPGFASSARAQSDVIEADGTHPAKAGPCVRFNGLDGFVRLRAKLDGCLTGARLAGDRAAAALAATLTRASHR